MADQTLPDIWGDPNLLSLVLGMAGSAAMGPYQDTWQSRLGKMAYGLGASRKAALAAEEANKKNEEFWNRVFGLLGGVEPSLGLRPTSTPSPEPNYSAGPVVCSRLGGMDVRTPSTDFLTTYLAGTTPEGMGLETSPFRRRTLPSSLL